MKKLMMLLGLLVLVFIPILAQGDVIVIPDAGYLVDNFGILMLTFTGIAAIATFVGEFFIRLIKSANKTVKIIIVFVLAVGLTFLAKVLNMGDYANMIWWQSCFWGLLSGAAAAGLRSTNLLFVKSVVEFLIGLVLQKEPKE